MKKIVYAGTFDPLTNGHWWVIKSALEIADKLLIFVAENPTKTTMFTAKERKQMIEEVSLSEGLENSIEVMVVRNEYVASKAIKMGADYMIRGIRNQIDFDSEALLQKANVDVIGGAKTIFVMPPRDLDSVSSSFIKSLVGPVGWHFKVKQFLPEAVYRKFLKRFIFDTSNDYLSEYEKDDISALLEKVWSSYSAKDRHYHNFEHIAHCLQEFQWYEANCEEKHFHPQSIVLAILAHDLVYGQKSVHSDEELSAQCLVDLIKSSYYASQLVLETQHTKENALKIETETFKLDKYLLKSIDLAILGQDWDVYDWYTKGVRKEYQIYEDKDYYPARKKVLKILLEKAKNHILFEHEMFYHYHEKAILNLLKELKMIEERK